jgi:saccharopine dehydrogenase-like NADP-dependent oxidoreductase
LRESGFLDTNAISVGGVAVRPIDVAAALLFPRWRLEEGDEEFTALQIAVRGREDGAERRYAYRLFDRTDLAAGVSSMARTTGYTCTAVARLVLEGRFARKGICPPEYVGADAACFEKVIEELSDRGVILERDRVPTAIGG